MADLDVTPPIEVDPDALAQDALEYMADQIPGFDPAAGTLVRFLLEATARIGAEGAELASAALEEVFRSFGPLVGVDPLEATAATVTSTWTLSDDAGHTIPQGILVEIQGDALSAAFEVQDDVTVLPGATATAAGEVVLNAVLEGAEGSGLEGPADLIDALDFVESIALVGVTAGGRDEEVTEDFNLRLADELRLLTPRPILPSDFSTLVQRRVAGIERALPLDGYDPTINERQQYGVIGASSGNYRLTFQGQQTANIAHSANAATVQTALEALSNLAPGDVVVSGGPAHSALVTVDFAGAYAATDVGQVTVQNVDLGGSPALTNTTVDSPGGRERTVAVAVHGPDGLAASAAAKAEAEALLAVEREVNFVVNIIDPTYTSIGVTFAAVALPGAEPATVEAQAEAAVADYLSPATWGRPSSGGLSETGETWFDTPVVRYLEVAAALDRVEGLDYITALSVEGGTVDVALPGAAALPVAGTVAGTVTAAA